MDESIINYADRIPNNVDLAGDRVLQRALERWQPAFLNWWQEAGPANTSTLEVYLRTAVSVDSRLPAEAGQGTALSAR